MATHLQAAFFSGELEVSWVDLSCMTRVSRLQLENDLIAAYVLWVVRPMPSFSADPPSSSRGRNSRTIEGNDDPEQRYPSDSARRVSGQALSGTRCNGT